MVLVNLLLKYLKNGIGMKLGRDKFSFSVIFDFPEPWVMNL
jgi:hypothetical protein